MTRGEHVAWAKERALEYVDQGLLESAIASLVSDLGKHSETQRHAGLLLLLTLKMPLRADEVRKYIDGFN